MTTTETPATPAPGAPTGRVAPKHAWAPIVLLIACALESGHALEHIAQLLQSKVFGVWPAVGLLGTALADNEWTHFAYNTTFWLLLVIVWFGYGAGARAFWKREHRAAYVAYVGLLIVAGIHMLEHWIRIVGYVRTGIAPQHGFIGQYVDLVYMHATFNLIEVIFLLYFVTKISADADVRFLERQRSIMSRAVSSTEGRASSWIAQGVALCAAPALIILSDTIGPVPIGDPSIAADRIAGAPLPFQIGATLGMFGGMLLVVAALGLGRAGSWNSGASSWGALLVAIGGFGLVASMGLFLFAGEAARIAGPDAANNPLIVELADRFTHPSGFMLLIWGMAFMLLPGFILVAWGLYSHKVIPIWVAIAMGLGITGQIVGHAKFDPGVYNAGNLALLVGCAWVGGQMIAGGRRRRANEHRDAATPSEVGPRKTPQPAPREPVTAFSTHAG